jgi:hypothetical protein
MNRLAPESRYPVSAFSARVWSEAASEPLEASDSAYAPSHSPESSRGRYRALSSGDPNSCTPYEARW